MCFLVRLLRHWIRGHQIFEQVFDLVFDKVFDQDQDGQDQDQDSQDQDAQDQDGFLQPFYNPLYNLFYIVPALN